MSSIYFRGFVCDEDCQHLAESLPSGDVFTLSDIGITIGRGTPDAAVVRHARESGCILVTGNKSHFVREMRLAAQRCTPARCFEGGGMITVPSGLDRLPYANLARRMTLGLERIGWAISWSSVCRSAASLSGITLQNATPVNDSVLAQMSHRDEDARDPCTISMKGRQILRCG